ncbi:MAG TPA: hypothetical protein VEA37_09695, partial [Flavobacterium sp.]|nr:hypothetical protein [Flavobacterium sp.]
MFAKISLMLALALGLTQYPLSAQVRRPLSQTVIIIDPGHGGHDPLAALSPLLEYDNRLVRLSEAEYAMD